MSKYFALPLETLQEVLQHLAKDPVAGLYGKVSQAIPVNDSSTPAPEAAGLETVPESTN